MIDSSIFIKNKFHFIGGEQYKDTVHHSLNVMTEKFDKNVTIWNESIRLSSLIYVEHIDRLLAFGGHSDHRISDDIWSCELLGGRNWNALRDLKFPMKAINFPSVITGDDRFIIFFGGRRGLRMDKQYMNTIYVLDLSTMKFHESGVQCPSHNDEFYAVLVPICGMGLLVVIFILRTMMIGKRNDIVTDSVKYIS